MRRGADSIIQAPPSSAHNARRRKPDTTPTSAAGGALKARLFAVLASVNQVAPELPGPVPASKEPSK